jgi:hypothetical protein
MDSIKVERGRVMHPLVEALLKQAEQLPPEDCLDLISRLADRIRVQNSSVSSPKYKVSEFRGIAPNLLVGIDAQMWVNQLRDEWDDREARLRPEP